MLARVIFVLAMLTLAPAVSGQESGMSHFDQATEAYNAGEYERAIFHYEQILKQGQHSAALYFNLANSYYKLGEPAPSIYYYEKALLLDPGDPEIRNNLGFARNMTLDAIEPLPKTDLKQAYENVVFYFGLDQWAILGVILMVLFVTGYLIFYLSGRPNIKRIALISSLAALMLAVAGTLMAYLQYRAYEADQPAIVFAEESEVRSEPNQRSPQAFLLHEGTKVQVLDSLGNWQKIELADGQIGWMQALDLKMLKDF